MKFKTDQAYILSIFATGIAYGDYSGIEDYPDDIADCEAWISQYPGAHFDFADQTYYGVCEITGALGDVIEITINTPIQENQA